MSKNNCTVDDLLNEFSGAGDVTLAGSETPSAIPMRQMGSDMQVSVSIPLPSKYEATLSGLLARLADSSVYIEHKPIDVGGIDYYIAYFTNAHATASPEGIIEELGFSPVQSGPDVDKLTNVYNMESGWIGKDGTFVAQFADGYIILPSSSVKNFNWNDQRIMDLVSPLQNQPKRTQKKS
jgi:hypothetical protein